MATKTEEYITDWFIDLKPQKMPVSFYYIRKSILAAVNELKPILHGKVLDLACGVMPYKKHLMNNNITDYIGVDLMPTEYHHEVKPDYYWDGITIPLEDASVDFVIATEFLEHYFDTSSILLEIKRVLKTGGIFFFTVPHLWPLHEVPYDFNRFTPFALDIYFKKTEFSSWEIRPLGGFHYHLLLSLALWYDHKVSAKKQKLLKPLFKIILNELMKKDKKENVYKNGQLISGLYGFVSK